MKHQFPCLLLAALAWMVIAHENQLAAVAQSDSSADTGTLSNRISINVLVKDQKGRPIHDLEADDFTVFDNKKPQNLLAFRAVADRDAAASYELTFKSPQSDNFDAYHAIEVRIDRQNLIIRSIRGYYAR